MKPTLAKACADLMSSGGACSKVDAKEGKMIACLEDKKDDNGVSAECKSEIQLDIELTSKDYR